AKKPVPKRSRQPAQHKQETREQSATAASQPASKQQRQPLKVKTVADKTPQVESTVEENSATAEKTTPEKTPTKRTSRSRKKKQDKELAQLGHQKDASEPESISLESELEDSTPRMKIVAPPNAELEVSPRKTKKGRTEPSIKAIAIPLVGP